MIAAAVVLLTAVAVGLLLLAAALRLAGVGQYRGAHRRYEPVEDPVSEPRPVRVPPPGHVRDRRYRSVPMARLSSP